MFFSFFRFFSLWFLHSLNISKLYNRIDENYEFGIRISNFNNLECDSYGCDEQMTNTNKSHVASNKQCWLEFDLIFFFRLRYFYFENKNSNTHVEKMSSFQKRRTTPLLPGGKHSLHTGQQLVSTGNPALDYVLGECEDVHKSNSNFALFFDRRWNWSEINEKRC